MNVFNAVWALETWWRDSKTFIEHSVGFENDALHVLVGPAIQLLAAGLLRTSIRSPWPWVSVLVLELINEWLDLRAERWPDAQMQWGEGVKDLLLTIALPTLLLAIARWRPNLLGAATRARGK